MTLNQLNLLLSILIYLCTQNSCTVDIIIIERIFWAILLVELLSELFLVLRIINEHNVTSFEVIR